MFYKILMNGESCHGGNMTWSLPKGDEPGDWHTHEGPAVMCASGFHVTDTPSKWYKTASSVYQAECEGFVQENTSEQKSLFTKVRLVRELTDEDLSSLGIFRKTTQVVTQMQAACFDSTVYANESIIRSYGRSIVFARGGSRVKAFDNTLVFADAGAQVELYDDAVAHVMPRSVSVNAWGRSRVFCNTSFNTGINSMRTGRIDSNIRQLHNRTVMPGVRLYDAAQAVSFFSEEIPSYA